MISETTVTHEPPAQGFMFMWSYYRSLSLLPEEDRLALYEAICRYSFFGEVPDLRDVPMSIFESEQVILTSFRSSFSACVDHNCLHVYFIVRL